MNAFAAVVGNELDHLTPRQREVFILVAKGYTKAEIAGMLYLSEGAVSNHITRAHQATELRTMEIVVLMAKAGWV